MRNQWYSALIFFVGFIFFFVVSVVFSYITWNDYNQSKDKPWPEHDCVVKSLEVSPCSNEDEETTNTRDSVILEAKVAEFPVGGRFPSPHDEEEGVITAYWTADEEACLQKDRVEEFEEELERNNNETKCYSNGHSVRLQKGGDSKWVVANYRLRAIFPIIAAIISGLTLCYAIYHVGVVYYDSRNRRSVRNDRNSHSFDYDAFNARMHRYGSRTPSDELSMERPPRAGHANGNRGPISGHDARLLITAFQEDKRGRSRRRSETGPEPCAICLENVESSENSSHVYLPCSHVYHEDCISQWFRKGSGSCPYCNHDLTDMMRCLREEAAENRLMEKSRRQLNVNERESAGEGSNSNESGEAPVESIRRVENVAGTDQGRANSEQGSSSYWSWGWLSRQLSWT